MNDLAHAATPVASPDTHINRDLHPVLPRRLLTLWFSRFDGRGAWLGPALAAAGVLVFLLSRPVARIVFAAGFAGGALELVLLLTYQALYGALYRQIGLLVTLFMAGLALGARLPLPDAPNPALRLRLVSLALAASALLLLFALPSLSALDRVASATWPGQIVICTLTLAFGLALGAQFTIASRVGSSPGAATLASLYSADCLGAACGSLLASLWLLPWLGTPGVCLISALLLAASFIPLPLFGRAH